SNKKYDDTRILLHTSLSGVFDSSLLDRVKADGFLSKFDGEELANTINQHITAFIPVLEQRGL
ncbi:MAG: hypothetical protein R3240_12465, partial [Gammaproteobacteria bacterium]|nr:hypothetical protein [Gammaproteobacteria bacterium]